MTSESSENSTSTTPFYLRPDNSLPIHTRDTYLLIATFVSVLIIMGIVIAFINRKCRNSLSRARFRLLHLRHRDALTAGHRRRRARSEETPIHHIHSLHDPKSPVYSKEVNVSLADHRATSGEEEKATKKTLSWDYACESGSCSSRVELDSGISVISSKTGISSCSIPECTSTREKTPTIREPANVRSACKGQLVKVLMPETLVRGHDLMTSNDDKYVQVKRMDRIAFGNPYPFYDTLKGKNKVPCLYKAYSGRHLRGPIHEGDSQEELQGGKVRKSNSQRTWNVGKRQLYKSGHQSSFDVISLYSNESSFEESFNSFYGKDDNRREYDGYQLQCDKTRETDLNANVKAPRNRPYADRVKHAEWTTDSAVSSKPPTFDALGSGGIGDSLNWKDGANHGALDLNRETSERSYDRRENSLGFNSLLPTLQEFGNFLQERRRKLSFSNKVDVRV